MLEKKMVFHKRLDYGSTGYQVPPMPRAPRSARGKRSVRKKVEDKPQISAFDLLATVAQELLSERENSPPPSKQSGSLDPIAVKDSVKHGLHGNEMPFKTAEDFDQGSCNESTCGSGNLSKRQAGYSLKEHQQTLKFIERKDVASGKRSESGCSLPPIAKKCCTDGFSSDLKRLCDYKLEIGVNAESHGSRPVTGNVMDGKAPEILEDPMDLDAKPPALVSSGSSAEVPVSRSRSFPKCREPHVDRDDDENSSVCTHPATNFSKAFKPQRPVDRRVRKLLASKFWNVPATTLKDGELPNNDVEMKPVFRSRKACYTRQRTQRSSFKRRKYFERSSILASNQGVYGEAMSGSTKFGKVKTEASDVHPSPSGANGASCSTSGQKSSYDSGDYHVKLSIKSFKVPELFIEIPESATVGSLKRTVMEAVTAILAGGLRVGVLHQGKKVRDDKQTLLQAGISRIGRMDNLGFTLEPNSAQTAPSLTCTEKPSSLLPSNPVLPSPLTDLIQRALPASAIIDQSKTEAAPEEPPQALNLIGPESDHDSVHSPANALSSSSTADKTADSKAIVPVPATLNAEALAAVPLRKSSRRSELIQRRIRRPFSVAEVESLVQAVETLGTGRWRDVKIRAFDNAKHRTYVDLKDKWKTLVHTARISPQQRRGEPVPQQLLDRVLSAHAYWAQQQAKLQVKPCQQAEPSCLII